MSTKETVSPTPADVLARVDRVLALAERYFAAQALPSHAQVLDSAVAFVWQRRPEGGSFRPVLHPDQVRMEDLIGIDAALKKLTRNTEQFLRGAPANHVLLWGERGTGKSSAVKALLHAYSARGLRLLQVQRSELLDLPQITDLLWGRPERYILFCDDLSFEADDAEYKELKAILEGGLHARPDNMLIYATSNRRHLMPERMADRIPTLEGDEAHPRDAIEEQLSLADRFGLRLSFYRIDQDTYLEIVHHMLAQRGLPKPATLERDALRWALQYSSRSGRTARQFVDDLEGRLALDA